MIEDEIFKRSKFVSDKLINYGFRHNRYKTNIDDFSCVIEIHDGKISGKIYDGDMEYTNFRVKNTTGYSSEIRDKYISLLEDIKRKCTIDMDFSSDQANRISGLIYEKYRVKPEFLWKDNGFGVFRNNKKWFGLIMNVSSDKFNLDIGLVDVLNVKVSDNRVINNTFIFPAYHMNKKSWVSIILNDSLSDEEVLKFIDNSYSFTVNTNEWIIPCNPNYFDVFDYVEGNDEVMWTRKANINVSDYVYLYISSPISSIIYKLVVTRIYDDYMYLKLLKKYDKNRYTFKFLNSFGVRAIRGPRHMPEKLSEYIKKDE